jgi:hypothetical protein
VQKRATYCWQSVLLLTPVQGHILPLWKIPLHAIVGGVARRSEPRDAL